MLLCIDKLYGDSDILFQLAIAPGHSANITGNRFTDHGITVLDWPANSPDLKPRENQ